VNNLDCRKYGSTLDPAWGRASYLFNATIAGIDAADALLIVGSNPRKEAAILNARIRKRWRAGKFPIGVIGPKAEFTYTYDYLGAGAETLATIARYSFADTLRKAERPLVLLGAEAFARTDGAAIASLAAKAAIDLGAVKDGWNGYCVLHNAASRVGALDLGFVPRDGGLNTRQMAASGSLDVLFLLGLDLYRLPRRPWRDPCRRGAARRGLPRKIGDLCQYRRPRADGDTRLVPARRCARRLGDIAGAVGCAGAAAALRLACRVAPILVQGASPSDAPRPDHAGRRGRCPKTRRSGRYAGQGAAAFER
jgi:hypothetical protein